MIACLWPWFGAGYRAESPPCRGSLSSHDGVGVMGAGTGVSEGLIPLDLPLCSVGNVSLKWYSQLHQVDGGGTPDDKVWALVSSNVLEEVILAWKVSCDLHGC